MSAGEVIEQVATGSGAPRPRRPRSAPRRASERRDDPLDRPHRARRDADAPAAIVTGLALDVIFPVLHGPYGEDGTIQGLLELANVPYVGAGVLASAVGMDKAVMKVVFAARGLPVCPYRVVLRHEWDADGAIGSPPSSRRALRLPDVRQAGEPRIERRHLEGEGRARTPRRRWTWRGSFDRKIVVEAAVPERARDRVRACSATTTPEASVPGEIIPSREFYDYEAEVPRRRIEDRDSGGPAGASSPTKSAGCRSRHSRRSTAPAWRASTSCSRATRRIVVPQRGEHDSRVHDDQHVLEAVGGVGGRLSGAARSADRARARASRRKAAAAHQRDMMPSAGRRRAARLVAGAALCLASAAASAKPIRGTYRRRRARSASTTSSSTPSSTRPTRSCSAPAARRRARPATCSTRPRPGGGSCSIPRAAALDDEFSAAVETRDRLHRGLGGARAGERRSAVLSRRRLRGPGPVARAARREAGGRARRQAHQGRRSNARSSSTPTSTMPTSASGCTSTTPTSRRRPRRCCGSCCCFPAATGPKGSRRCCGRGRAAGCCRGKPTTSFRSSISGTSIGPTRRSPCSSRCTTATLAIRCSSRNSPKSRTSTSTTSRASLDTWRTLLAVAREQRVNEPRLAEIQARLGVARQLDAPAPDRPRARAAARGDRGAADAAVRRARGGVPRPGRSGGSPGPSRRGGRRLSSCHRQRAGTRSAEPARARVGPASSCARPDRAEAYRLSLDGFRKLEGSDVAGAQALLARSIALNPKDPVARYRYGRVLQARKDDAAALDAVRARDPRRARVSGADRGSRVPRSGAAARAARSHGSGDRLLPHREHAGSAAQARRAPPRIAR